MPWCDWGSRAFGALGGDAVSAARASSEITSPVVLFSRRARSFAAARMSSAMSRVVRMHLMLTHHGSVVEVRVGRLRNLDSLPRRSTSALHLVSQEGSISRAPLK